MPNPTGDGHYGQSPHDGFGSLAGHPTSGEIEADDDDAFELNSAAEMTADPADLPQDELLLDAGRLAQGDHEDAPATGRRRRFFGSAGETDPAPAPEQAPGASAAGGSTLFERMANLSRTSSAAEEEDDDDGSSALRIPRFLGRTNNQ